ncbi:MAG TPA: hypothetical protein GX699_10990 [Firmicutes bacterium]|nr:hypothetical protein [Bacillota bacterium]
MQVEIEKRGIPAVSIITTPFLRDAQASAEMFGYPGVRRVVLPHPVGDSARKDTPAKVKAAFGDIVTALTAPLTEEESRTGVQKAVPRDRIVCKGTIDEVYRFFVEKGMCDGLPIVPPTEERVKRMLAGTSHAPDEVLGKMDPEQWEVTVEKVAVNAAMCGCLPEYMPVLLALAEALIDSRTMTGTYVRSTSSFAFWSVVNGPIAKEIGMNARNNALGPGNRANATIGRAIRMFLINLGGTEPGVNDMSSIGNVLKYGFAFAENEAESPWEPYHVTHGFKPEESTITIFRSWGFRPTSITAGNGMGLANIAWNAQVVGGGMVILMDPLLAKELAEQGITKKNIQEYLYQSLQRSVREWKQRPNFRHAFLESGVPAWYAELADDVMIPRLASLDSVQTIVVGGQNNPFYQLYDASPPVKGITISVDKWR